jgi:hypothetical protein
MEHQKHAETHVVGLFLALLGATAQAEDEVKGRLLLNIIVTESAPILKLLAGKDQALLIRRNAKIINQCHSTFDSIIWCSSPFFVLDLGLDIVNSIRGFHLKGDCFSSEATNDKRMSLREEFFGAALTSSQRSASCTRRRISSRSERKTGIMLTGHLYLSSELSGGVFDEASRSKFEAQEMDSCLRLFVDGLCVGTK